MRTLVTGGNGMIGSRVVSDLLERGAEARALVRPGADRSSLDGLDVEVIEADVRDRDAVHRAVRGCDRIIHLAAARASKNYDVALFGPVNTEGTQNLADAAASEGVARLVYASSSGVYGLVARGPIDESFPVRAYSHYRVSKMEAERRLLARFRTDGLPVVIARLSGTVGPGERGWVPFFSAAIRPNFRLVGNGTNRIQLGYVTDAADALIRCAETPDIDGEIFNISGVEPITVRAFVDEVRQTLGVPGAYGHLPAAPFRVYSHFAAAIFRLTRREIPRAKHYGMFLTQNEFDLSKARDRLGYEPQVTTAECARRMATYYREEGLV